MEHIPINFNRNVNRLLYLLAVHGTHTVPINFNRNVNRLLYLLAAHGTHTYQLQLEQELYSVGTRPN